MMSFGVVTWILLSGLTAGEAAITVSGCVGGYISFSCSYHFADTNTKYFCRDPCTADQHILVRSGRSPTGRYRLEDLGNGHSTVTITDLQKSDAGTYWCGVERYVKDTYHKVLLSVTNAPTSNINPPKATPRVATPRTVGSNEASTFPQSIIPPRTTCPSAISSSTPKPTLPAQRSLYTSSPSTDGHGVTGTLLYTAAGLGALVITLGLCLVTLHKCKKTTSKSLQCPGAEPVYAEVKKPQAAITQGDGAASSASEDTRENPLYSSVELKEDPFIYSTAQELVY